MCSHLGDCEGICGTRDGRGLGGEAVHCLVAPPAHLAQDPVTIAVRFGVDSDEDVTHAVTVGPVGADAAHQ